MNHFISQRRALDICVGERRRSAPSWKTNLMVTTKWNISVTWTRSDSHFPLSAGVDAAGLTLRPLLQNIYHRVPFKNVGLPRPSLAQPFSGISAFTIIFHNFSQVHHTSVNKTPRHFHRTLCCYPLSPSTGSHQEQRALGADELWTIGFLCETLTPFRCEPTVKRKRERENSGSRWRLHSFVSVSVLACKSSVN